MRALFATLLLALAGLNAHAADVALPSGGAGSARAADDSLYRAFGEKAGLALLMTDFVGRLKNDTQIGRYFKDVNAKHLAEQLTDQLCMVAGGPCEYEGAAMKPSHAELGITRADFNRLVEVLQDTMAARDIAFGTQRQMLARLAPMVRDIQTK